MRGGRKKEEGRGKQWIRSSPPLVVKGRRRKSGGGVVGKEVGGNKQRATGDRLSRKSGENEGEEVCNTLVRLTL